VFRRLVLILVLLVVVHVWVGPALAGPTVDCGTLDQAACEEAVRHVLWEAELADNPWRPPVPIPVSYVAITSASPCGSPGFTMSWVIPIWGYGTPGGLC
jgi:hypothetical protein